MCVLHHCLSIAEREDDATLLGLLRHTAGSVEQIVEHCCGLLNVPCVTPTAGVMADVVQMASDILLHLGMFVVVVFFFAFL